MKLASVIRSAAVTLVAALGLSLLITPASADSETRQIVGVGSDTTQDVLNGLGNVIPDPNGTPDNQLIQSYNATGATPVTCRVGGVIPRPNGSVAGVDALRNDLANPATDCVDFARSSRGPANPNSPGARLAWIPFAKDAVTVAVRSNSALNDGVGFTTAQLRDIYTCTKATHNGVPLTPLLPHPGSGTRAFFLEKIGVTEPQIGACVNGTVQVNDGTVLDTAGDLVPYSVAQYIAQTSAVVIDRHGVAVLSRVNGVPPRNANGTLNVNFPFAHDVYNVVPIAKLTGGATPDVDLISAFETPTSKVCAQTAVIALYGFAPIGSDCGRTTLKG